MIFLMNDAVSPPGRWKNPVSVLVVVYRIAPGGKLEILLLERADHPGYWQSVTGSLEEEETPRMAARREVYEETGILAPTEDFLDWHWRQEYDIFPEWRHRYAPDVTRNIEHVFSLAAADTARVRLSLAEHRAFQWLPPAAAALCFSPSNREAIAALLSRVAL
jgi:dATP pyrophosphohydrolase